MKSLASRVLTSVMLALLVWLLSVAAGGTRTIKQPDKLVILSTTDVKGKTSPCG
jgi:hypothetical protein